jgi:hypothetical protein
MISGPTTGTMLSRPIDALSTSAKCVKDSGNHGFVATWNVSCLVELAILSIQLWNVWDAASQISRWIISTCTVMSELYEPPNLGVERLGGITQVREGQSAALERGNYT